MQNKNKFLFLIAILSFLISLSSPTRGWTADKPSITIHNLINLTGIYAPISVPYEKGGKDFLAWIADQGGLDVDLDGKGDVEIKYSWAEIDDDKAQFISAYKRFRMGKARFSIIEMVSFPKPRPVILEMWVPSHLESIKATLERDRIVGIGIGFNEHDIYPPSWNFSNGGSLIESAAGAIEYYIDHLWQKRGKGVKAKVAFLTLETAYGKAPNGLVKRHGEETGKYEVVAEPFIKSTPNGQEVIDFLSDFEKRGIDIIWSSATVQTSAAIMRGIHKLGLKNKVVLIANSNSPVDQLLDIAGPGSVEGYICTQSVFVPAAEPEEPGVKFARMLNEKYRKDPRLPNIHYMHGIRMKANILESVRRALVRMMKGDHIDLVKACKWISGKDVKEFGVQTLAGYAAYETTIKFQSAPSGKDDRRLANHERLVGIKNGKVMILSPWYKVPRLIPMDMIQQGLFKDETVNIHSLPMR